MVQLPPALNTVKNLLQGKGMVSHPIHVAINHAPLGLWEGGVVFDLMSTQRKWRNLGEAGYYLNLFGIVAAIPTIATGAAEFADIPTDHPAWKVTVAHAALNNVALGMAVYNWLSRRNRRNHAPNTTNLWVDGALTAVLGLSGYLGGVIAHEYGYGTHRQGTSVNKERESLVGPQDQIENPKIVLTESALPESSVDSWAGTSQAEVNDRDAAVETQFAAPGDRREIGGTGI